MADNIMDVKEGRSTLIIINIFCALCVFVRVDVDGWRKKIIDYFGAV